MIHLSDVKAKIKTFFQFYNSADNSGLKLTLFQYQPCPFCKKVRAYLDYTGLSYKVVEVNPVTKSQLGWSSYKKVPILMAELKEGHQVVIICYVILRNFLIYIFISKSMTAQLSYQHYNHTLKAMTGIF